MVEKMDWAEITRAIIRVLFTYGRATVHRKYRGAVLALLSAGNPIRIEQETAEKTILVLM